jgi:hypothetical protein
MPSLPVVCVACHRTYKSAVVSRPFPWDHIDGHCPECTAELDLRLFGGRPIAATFGPVYCACGRQLVSPAQHVAGRCEFCEVGEAVHV